jgi:copper chaperone
MVDTVKIKGMSCNHCVMAVKKALDELPGVSNVNVNLEKGEATFEREGAVEKDLITKTIEKAGYAVG